MGDQVIALKNKAYTIVAVCIPVAVLEVLGRGPVNNQVPAVVLVKPADQIQTGGFA
ncbi:hypothetical protein D3C75_1059940 [compost metagenome]